MPVIIPDYYHLNFGDGPLPIARIFSNPFVGGVYLKHSEGTSYGDWAPVQAKAVRAAGHRIGAYHMLSGSSSGDGAAQYRYFRTKYTPHDGDLVIMLDFERSGQGTTEPNADYRARGVGFIRAAHADGLEVMLYGHERVNALFADWRDSGADYWNSPGDVVHSDVGPVGPDLWQYSPYTAVAGLPNNVSGKAGRDDISKVLTSLPLIGGGKDAADMAYAQDYHTGQMRFANAQGEPDAGAPDGVKDGFAAAKGVYDRATNYADAHDATGGTVNKAALDKHAADPAAHHGHAAVKHPA